MHKVILGIIVFVVAGCNENNQLTQHSLLTEVQKTLLNNKPMMDKEIFEKFKKESETEQCLKK